MVARSSYLRALLLTQPQTQSRGRPVPLPLTAVIDRRLGPWGATDADGEGQGDRKRASMQRNGALR